MANLLRPAQLAWSKEQGGRRETAEKKHRWRRLAKVQESASSTYVPSFAACLWVPTNPNLEHLPCPLSPLSLSLSLHSSIPPAPCVFVAFAACGFCAILPFLAWQKCRKFAQVTCLITFFPKFSLAFFRGQTDRQRPTPIDGLHKYQQAIRLRLPACPCVELYYVCRRHCSFDCRLTAESQKERGAECRANAFWSGD